MPFSPQKNIKNARLATLARYVHNYLAKRLDVRTYVEKRGRKLLFSSTWRSREKLPIWFSRFFFLDLLKGKIQLCDTVHTFFFTSSLPYFSSKSSVPHIFLSSLETGFFFSCTVERRGGGRWAAASWQKQKKRFGKPTARVFLQSYSFFFHGHCAIFAKIAQQNDLNAASPRTAEQYCMSVVFFSINVCENTVAANKFCENTAAENSKKQKKLSVGLAGCEKCPIPPPPPHPP